MIEIRELRKTYVGQDGGLVEALHDVDLDVRPNEFLTVLGPSGCGKTTLLKCIAGLIPWDDGDILIDGTPVRGPGPDRSMVFQNFALLPWATVLDNVAFGLRMRGVGRAEREERARVLIKKVGLAGFETKRPGELSGGMQQRVGLARALAVQPQVLLMDEPFGAVDEQTRRLLQEELLSIWEEHRLTVVFITHSMEEAVLLGDRVVLMSARPGQIAEIVPVPLERPRSSDVGALERSGQYVEITAYLWDRLRDMHEEHRPAKAAG
ncbi:NitT/TauT family transport system ATP-binding protein [Actinomadura pelletieri DSM 43383]|uniref:NitT/TauT family transport system ATP-binding protein n=1 Tax=Actinomadura pelletieri DSM 43383 TaxID=1120940 RepID=A0A495Q8Q6_9ACTN|nr:ABC transporter ATP-binding protein [Actinomadura pelletieri]RKS67713.1 NitT/TauT family transport system ATP-binding protein [Actinomadura pelletieri DSM 43383]